MIVLIESPYAGDIIKNIQYGQACLRDSLLRGESPFASHLLYTQNNVLDDNDKEERQLGMQAGWKFIHLADLIAVYQDFGISDGMRDGISIAKNLGKMITYRNIL